MKLSIFFGLASLRPYQTFSVIILLSITMVSCSCISNDNDGTEESNSTTLGLKMDTGLERDSRLIGVWEKVSYNRMGVHNEKRLAFYGDGTMELLTRTYAVTTDGGASFSFDDGWVKNQQVQTSIAAGTRWYTRNGILLNKLPDGNEIIDCYYEIESYNGKSNLFTMNSPNQKKPTEMFRKIR